MEKFGTGTEVAWKSGLDTAHGTVTENLVENRTAAGEEVRRNASEDNPAYLIEQANGDKVVKSHSQLRSIVGEDRHVPPEAVARVVERGLALREKLKRQGKTIGIAHARDLKNRRPVSDSTVRHMMRFFARHEAAGPTQGEGEDLSPDYVAWLLWGGAPGREWAEREKASLDEAAR